MRSTNVLTTFSQKSRLPLIGLSVYTTDENKKKKKKGNNYTTMKPEGCFLWKHLALNVSQKKCFSLHQFKLQIPRMFWKKWVHTKPKYFLDNINQTKLIMVRKTCLCSTGSTKKFRQAGINRPQYHHLISTCHLSLDPMPDSDL